MNLEDSDLGEDYLDDTTWQMLNGVPERNIPPPTATGACDTVVIYKFTPPACVKTVRFQITTMSDEYEFGVVDGDTLSQGKCTNRGDDISYSRVHSFVLSFSRSFGHSFARSLVYSFSFHSVSPSLVHSFSPSLVLSLTR